jgi:hypothetical protein
MWPGDEFHTPGRGLTCVHTRSRKSTVNGQRSTVNGHTAVHIPVHTPRVHTYLEHVHCAVPCDEFHTPGRPLLNVHTRSSHVDGHTTVHIPVHTPRVHTYLDHAHHVVACGW